MELEQATEAAGETGTESPGSPEDPLFREGLPPLSTALDRDEIVRRLDAAARRGKLAGFAARSGGDLFEVEAYSAPFEHVLVARPAGGPPTRLTFQLRMLRKVPLIFGVVLVLTLWPGLPLTHSMLTTYFSWYRLSEAVTAAWYVPLTVLPVLWWLPRAVRKSRAEARAAAKEQILRLRGLLDGTLTQG